MDDEEVNRKLRLLLERTESMGEHDTAKLVAMAKVLNMEQIKIMPTILDRAAWWNGFEVRAKRWVYVVTVVIGVIYWLWDIIKPALISALQGGSP